MADMAEEEGMALDRQALQNRLGMPVVICEANTGKGIIELKTAMSRETLDPPALSLDISEEVRTRLEAIRERFANVGLIEANSPLVETVALLGDRDPTHYGVGDEQWTVVEEARNKLEQEIPEWEDGAIAARYDLAHEIAELGAKKESETGASLTDRLDAWLLHPVVGWLALLGLMATLFFLIFSFADKPMGWIEAFFDSVSSAVSARMAAGDLRDLITDGVIAGVGGVVVFLPQLLILFFFISLMEDSGYMARVAFLMDRLMGKVGLSGRSFLPLLSSYACAVPGVMAARTIDSPKDRLITILVAPLTSCSARLPVYLILIATMVPSETVPIGTKVGFMLLMYVLGTAGAFVCAWLFSQKLMKGESSPMMLELPPYRVPKITALLLHMWERAKIFIRRAGTIIMGISILLWAAATYPKSSDPDPAVQLEYSAAGRLGKAIEPVITPLGYDWKIGVGLIASFAAREVFVSTMSIIYSVEGDDDDVQPLRQRLLEETRSDGSQLYTPLLCLSLMVFYVFAMQCMSTVAVVKRETNGWKWPLFQIGYMTTLAYLAALVVYQVGRAMGYS